MPIVPAPGDYDNEDWQRKPKYSERTCPSATLSTTNPILPDPGLNPARRGGKPVTNRLNYGAAYCRRLTLNFTTPNSERQKKSYATGCAADHSGRAV
jgi:hypothetical protein